VRFHWNGEHKPYTKTSRGVERQAGNEHVKLSEQIVPEEKRKTSNTASTSPNDDVHQSGRSSVRAVDLADRLLIACSP
jgi:hypothetical protein